MPSLADITYEIGSAAIEVPFSAFSSLKANICNYSWTYSGSFATNPFGGGIFEDYVTLDTAGQKFLIYSTTGVPQSLSIVLTGTTDNSQAFSTSFGVEYVAPPEEETIFVMPSNLAPEFVESLQTY